MVTLDAEEPSRGGAVLRLAITLTRPSTEADRQSWNTDLAFADIGWMDQVRVWDADSQWLWPNLPYLLRLPGRERIERYGGIDPGKHVDNDFAAVLIRKYDASGRTESAETRDAPLVSAEWHAADATSVDGRSIVHTARSDMFLVRVGGPSDSARGRLKVWLIYADFFGELPPRTWPDEREYAGGILAYFEIDWETADEGRVQGTVRHVRPREGTRFDWQEWVVRTPGSEFAKAEARLTDRDGPSSSQQ